MSEVKLPEAQRALLCAPLFGDSPRGVPALCCDTSYSYSVQRALVDKGLAERETDGRGGAWFYLTAKGRKLRDKLRWERPK